MKNIQCSLLIFISLFILNSCSKDDDSPSCPDTQTISMKINGEYKEFNISIISLDFDGTKHTLGLSITNGTYSPEQNSYDISIVLPYRKTGKNVLEEFNYYRVQNGSSAFGDFVQGELNSKVTINRSTCFSMTFSGKAIIGGNEVIITDGILNYVYETPFD